MKKIAAITFQGAHNYGSSLQCYALQQFVGDLCRQAGVEYNYEVINYRTDMQRYLYNVMPRVRGVKDLVKWAMRLPYVKQYKKKHDGFEAFITNEINTGREVLTFEEIAASYGDYDYFISGSDQIWNVRSRDFSDAYYLTFAPEGAKKISYAASMGPLKIDWEKYDSEKYTKLLNEYSAISVREQGTAENVEYLTGKVPEIHVDPTLLLSKEEWKNISSGRNYNQGQYILLYCLEPSKKQLEMVDTISKVLGLPVVMTRYNNKTDYFNPYVKLYDVAPKDFLGLVENAAFVVTSSFHGTAFSVIYEKEFLSLDGMNDKRISNLLTLIGLESRGVTVQTLVQRLDDLEKVDYTQARKVLQNERERSAQYLRQALDL